MGAGRTETWGRRFFVAEAAVLKTLEDWHRSFGEPHAPR